MEWKIPGHWPKYVKVALPLIPIGLILLAAAIFRFYGLDYMEFKADEAIALKLVDDFIVGGSWPKVGLMSSVGVYNPPIFIYLLALPSLLSRDPVFVTAFVALLNLLAIALGYRMVKRFWGMGPALLTAALFALSPWAIIYSRKIWAQDFLPFFIVALLYVMLHLRERAKSKVILWVPVLLCIIWQLHFSSYFIIAMIVLIFVLWFRKIRPNWLFLGLGLVIAIGLTVPYLVHLVQTDFQDISKILSTGSRTKVALNIAPLQYTVDLLAQGNFKYNLGAGAAGLPVIGSTLLALLFFAGLTYGLVRTGGAVKFRKSFPFVETEGQEHNLLMLLWIIAPIVLFTILKMRTFPHYFIIIYPASFIVIAVLIGDLFGALKKSFTGWPRRIVLTLLSSAVGVLLLVQLIASARTISYIVKTGGAPGDYGTAYRHKIDLVQYVAGESAAQGAIDQSPGRHGLHGAYEYRFLLERMLGRGKKLRLPFRVVETLRYRGRACPKGKRFGSILACPLFRKR